MKFASARVEQEFNEALHSETKLLLLELDREHVKWREVDATFPELTITCITRTPEENAALYDGKPRFSWHILSTAADVRNKHYRMRQKVLVTAWIIRYTKASSLWELVFKDHGTGPHWHLAHKDFGLRRAAGL